MQTRIPKIIHYARFGGGEKSQLIKDCIESWSRHLPNYEIVEWNESNFDLNSLPIFCKKAMKLKKWAFVTDYVRLKVLYDYGGIYLDSDVEVFRNLDTFLDNKLFAGTMGDYGEVVIEPVILGAEEGNVFIKKVMEYYESLKDFDFNNVIPRIITNIFEKETGLKINDVGKVYESNGMKIYTHKTFLVTTSNKEEKNIQQVQRKRAKKEGLYIVHYAATSWMPKWFKFLGKIGVDTFIAKICKKLGITKIVKKILKVGT